MSDSINSRHSPQILLNIPKDKEHFRVQLCDLRTNDGVDRSGASEDWCVHVNDPNSKTRSDDCFVKDLMSSQRKLYEYIASLVAIRADAEDLFQKTCLTAWQRRDTYDPERDFFSWNCGIAHNHIRNFFRSKQQSQVCLPPDLLDQLSARLVENAAAVQDERNQQYDALMACLGKLPEKQRELIKSYYRSEATVKEFSKDYCIGLEALYKRLQRIRITLAQCVQKTASGELA